VQRYAITSGLPGIDPKLLLEQAQRWAADRMTYVQLREPHRDPGELAEIARSMHAIFLQAGGTTRLLVNHRVDVAAATGCGVHLTARPGELTPTQVRQVLCAAVGTEISVSCHTLADVHRAVAERADLILFGPVFEKRVDGDLVMKGVGLDVLREVCVAAGNVPVFALGGVTISNASICLQAGAAGIAGIRTFAR
jgi:thiamine-phosphate pyrophosphorylase